MKRILLELVMVAVAVVFLFPVYALITLSLKDPAQIASHPLGLPKPPTTANFTQAWSEASLGSALLNSTLITAGSLVLLIALGSFAAYYLARQASRLGYGLYILFLLGIILPFQLGMIPLYKSFADLDLIGSYEAIIIFYTGIQLPFTVFLYIGFLRALPIDFEDAALIDGCSPWQVFRYVVFPMLKPITVTALVLNAIAIWNDFFTPLLYLSGSDQQTMPVAVAGFVGQFVTDWNLIFAALLISIVPILVVYFALQRSIINGFAGGLKG